MSSYVIGDVQGCFSGLKRLLDKLHFSDSDTLYFAGDLINRGQESLETLRFIKALPKAHTVLGNHDIHLLALYHNARTHNSGDTLQAVLQADDAKDLIHWLSQQPLLLHLPEFNSLIAHAGIHPKWTLKETLKHAKTVQTALQSPEPKTILNEAFGNTPNCWHDNLAGTDNIRCLINYFTRMRYCTEDGSLDFTYKGKPPHPNKTFKPWFDHSLMIEEKILFGHWAAIEGKLQHNQVIALDTGYVWGGKLTAYRLEDNIFFQVKAA